MFVTDANYKSIESSPHDEVSYSDVENVSVSPNDHRAEEIIIAEQSIIDDRSSNKGARNDESKSWTMAKVQVGYDVTRKGERSLVVDGFKFTKSRDGTNNRVFWRCSRRECKATAVTVCDRVEHVRAIHAHEPPLAAEFFGSHEGLLQHCELQEVRFNTNAANMRPRYRKSNISMSESNPDELPFIKNVSNSTNHFQNGTIILEQRTSPMKTENISPQYHVQNIEIKPSTYMLQNSQQKITSSVKDQVREFILRNSTQINNYPQSNGVSVAQFLIAPAPQSPFLHGSANNNNSTSSNNMVSSSIVNSPAAFNFNPVHINALSGNNNHSGSDSTSDISSHKSTPALINVPTTLHIDQNTVKSQRSTNDTAAVTAAPVNQMHVEQILQLLLKNSGGSHHQKHNRQRVSSDSEWSSPTPGPGVQQCDLPTYANSPSVLVSSAAPDGYQASTPSRFIHWKKERLRESEINYEDLTHNDRKRRYDNANFDHTNQYSHHPIDSSTTPSPDNDSKQLCSFLTNVRPIITKKLMAVIHKLTSELCPEEAVAQEVFEKCTAIRTCLETLEKLHSLAIAE